MISISFGFHLLTSTVVGFCFESAYSASEKCQPGEHWVRAHTQAAYIRTDGTLVRAHKVSAHCRTNPKSFGDWGPRLKNEKPTVWGYYGEKTKPWSPGEIERVLEALDDLPELLLQQTISSIFRMEKSEDPGNAATTNVARGESSLYDEAFSDKRNLTRILAHEFAHQLYQDMPSAKRTDYLKEMGWNKDTPRNNGWGTSRSAKQFVTDSSRHAPQEDFANNIEFYLFDSKQLKKAFPKVIEWIERNFGKEFKVRKDGK